MFNKQTQPTYQLYTLMGASGFNGDACDTVAYV